MSKHPCLRLYVNSSNNELVKVYQTAIEKHNTQVLNDPFPNAGFDLYIPEETIIQHNEQFNGTLVDLQVKSEMTENDTPLAYYLYPRSSLSKTPLMLSHSVGIIDCGYRGFIKASLRNFQKDPYTIEQHSRLTQIVHPSMKPFIVQLLEKESDLSSTSRGEGGFGSTGK